MTTTLSELVRGDCDEAILSSIREQFRHEIFHGREGLSYEELCALTYERMRWLNKRLPSGAALLKDPTRLLAVLECSAVASPSLFLALTIHYCLSLSAVMEFGRGRDDLETELGSMSSIGTLLVTELGNGNSHAAIRTEAVHDPVGGGFVLRTPDPGAQKFMSNNGLPGVPKLGVVYARLFVGGQNCGVFPFAVPLRGDRGLMPGIRIGALPNAPLLPLDYAVVSFDDVRLQAHSLLSDDARLYEDGTFHDPLGSPEARLSRSLEIRQNAWIAAAAACAAAARASSAIALHHAHQRISRSRLSAERPVIGFRPQQRALFGALAASYAVTCLVNEAKRAWVGGRSGGVWAPGAALSRTLGLTKAFAGWVSERVAGECMARSGAHGVFSVNRLVEYRGLGIMMNPAAGDSFLITLEAGRTLAEGHGYTPPVVELPEPLDLSTPATWRALAQARERGLHSQLLNRLAVARRRGQSAFEMWDNRQELGRELADAHVRRLALDSLLSAVDRVDDPVARAALDPLCMLYALDEIAAHADWYVGEGLLPSQQIQRLSTLRDTACERILPHSRKLVDAFVITDNLLQVPMTGPPPFVDTPLR
ncbi:acyl-CoA dehydrogenase [Pseudonocardia sp. H11422]|uniref:acyl-CoA dehydrogenase n=1 Tax=Pseudonocardia sp. H11422 TaxID=2835866 RepID=UPI001BDBE214|nr:acyl-CoA dehydrogenase [Pseudonocardia sp. H11422]